MEEREFTLLPYFAGPRIVSCSMCQLHLPHTCDKIGIPTVCRGVGCQMGEMGREEVKDVNIHGRPSLHNINLTSSLVITS